MSGTISSGKPAKTPKAAAKEATPNRPRARPQGRPLQRRPTGASPRRREEISVGARQSRDGGALPNRKGPPPARANLRRLRRRLNLDIGAMTAEQRAVVEKLSANLARAALTAQGAITDMALRQADRPAALSPDPFHVAPAMTEVMGRLAAQPDRLMRAHADLFSQYLELWQATTRRMAGETPDPVATPARGDKRFADPEWAENPVFDVIKQSYLLTSNWVNGLVSEVTDVEPMAKRRVEFFMKMLTDAFSPSNFLASNPAALREVMATGGESLVRGMENFAADLERGGGQLSNSQTDY